MKNKPCGTIECPKYIKGVYDTPAKKHISNCNMFYIRGFKQCSRYKPEEEMKNEKKITELQNKLNKAVENVEAVREELEQLKKDPDLIMVPDNIHLSDGEYIAFNNDKQWLSLNDELYHIDELCEFFSSKPHKLIEFEELEKEKIYYHSDCGLDDINRLRNYGIYDGEEFIFINYNEMPVKTDNDYSTILQAVPIEV